MSICLPICLTVCFPSNLFYVCLVCMPAYLYVLSVCSVCLLLSLYVIGREKHTLVGVFFWGVGRERGVRKRVSPGVACSLEKPERAVRDR